MSARAVRASSALWPRAKKTNVRRPLGALIGRSHVIDSIERGFRSGARLQTLLGPPGIGKTRVALEFLATHREGNGWFCDLSEVHEEAALVHAVSSLFPSPRVESDDGLNMVERALAAMGKALVVLDNFEQLTAFSHLVSRWCEAAPNLHILATSRERLAIDGEHVIELEPLSCPGDTDDRTRIEESEAVRLFVSRAEAAGARLANDYPSIASLVRKLDGIPLAIELCAARARVFSPKELAARLDQRFELLSRPRPVDGRHATLASAIEWSWNLLSREEQLTLSACTVFAGSFSADAAEAVIVLDDAEASPALRIAALRDKSLLHTTSEGRLALYLSIRDYAAHALDSESATKMGLLHARYFATRARDFNRSRTLQGAEPDGSARGALALEKENLLAALERLGRELEKSRTHAELFAEVAIALTHLQGAPSESCRVALDTAFRALDDRRDEVAEEIRARLLLARQGLHASSGRYKESMADLQALLASDLSPGMRAFTLCMKGILLWYQSSPHEALACHQEARAILDTLDLPRLQATNYACEGRLHGDLGEVTLARELNDLARKFARKIDDCWLEALGLGNLGQVEQEAQNFSTAADHIEQALARFRAANEEHYVAVYSSIFGDLLFEWGKLDEARRSYERAAPFLDRWSSFRGVVQLYSAWGALEAMAGDARTAESHFAKARRAAARSDSPIVRVIVETHEAQLALRRARDSGDPARLAREIAKWRARVSELSHRDVPDRSTVRTSIDARFAVRMLAKSLVTNDNASPPGALSLAQDATWFRIDDGPRIDLQRRGSLRRILSALVDARASSPGAAVSRDDLLAKGWPGQKLHPEAASKRLRVAIATLRTLGLRSILLTRDDGYLVDPSIAIRDEPGSSAS